MNKVVEFVKSNKGLIVKGLVGLGVVGAITIAAKALLADKSDELDIMEFSTEEAEQNSEE